MSTYIVMRYPYPGSYNGHEVSYSVWEKWDHHSYKTVINGVEYGSPIMRQLPLKVACMGSGVLRNSTIDTWCRQNEEDCYAAIVTAYPEAMYGTRINGNIDTYCYDERETEFVTVEL